MKKFLLGAATGFVFLVAILGGAISDRLWGYQPLDKWFPRSGSTESSFHSNNIRVVNEENVVIEVVEQVTPSVVTVGIKTRQRIIDPGSFSFDPFDFFGFRQPTVQEKEVEQDIGSGFIVSAEGLVVTNKHVVADIEAEYKVITADDREYPVEKIYRDPINDLAILKISALDGMNLQPVDLGDSEALKVGQFVIAIGTALGEFRSTVTTGVISGLGRGIQAGNGFSGQVESLDNVIQTDAAINPGNSGGPLLNSVGEVIAVNVATTQGAENIGFAIPINIVRQSLEEFEETGSFSRAFLGVRYKMIDQRTAILNEVPEGAYVVEVIADSPADKSGIQEGDILIAIDGQVLKQAEAGLIEIINHKKAGEEVKIELWRDGETRELKIRLEEIGE
ncbi:trypsin-like peptidase domain-containing protein [Patescibacteria group bacterium]|nr:trypsin-like peptidase domain-containing protein [Patescibacteria group bacterium]